MEMRKKIFAIVGETCSGKDSLVKHIEELDPQKYKAVVSYTNRPKRDSETDGVEHYFLSPEQFTELRIKENDKVVTYTKIASPSDPSKGYEYMATVDELNKSLFYIIDPNGLNYLKTNFGAIYDIISIYIYAPKEMRKERAKKTRSDYEKEFEKRCTSEKLQFNDFYSNKCYNYIIYNFDGLEKETFNTFKRIVDYELNERRIGNEEITIFNEQYKKKDLMKALSNMKTVYEFFMNNYIENNRMVRNIIEELKMIQNIILDKLR